VNTGAIKPKAQIVWLKRDLRIADQAALVAAADSEGFVIPLYVVERDYWHLPETSARQWSFIRECLLELNMRLTELGAPLIVKSGRVIDVLAALNTQFDITLHSHEETGNKWTYQRDKAVKSWCRDNDVAWHEYQQFGVFRPLKDRDGWSKKWDAFMGQPKIETPDWLRGTDLLSDPMPTWRDLGMPPDPCPERQKGGRKAARRLLDSFLYERGETYRKAMSSPVTAFDECSRLSPYLAYGCLSMRETAQALWARQRELKQLAAAGEKVGTWRGSMTSFSGRLHWHCHFTQKLESEPEIEFRNLHSGYDGLRPNPSEDPAAAERLWAWREGQMGLPFADACMRALNATGYLNFRMRAMLMAVSSYHLWLHWREPGLAYARKFTDFEPGIHWPQVQMQSGTTGMNTVRVYNPVKQGYDQDPTGEFTRRWVPELADVPDKFLQEPWKWEEAASVIPRLYPERIIDHEQAAREAKAKIYGLRREPGFREISLEIVKKHGSRKRPSRRRPARRHKARKEAQTPDPQGSLF
jgi:deoxyribodipyrimidine photo-lyase